MRDCANARCTAQLPEDYQYNFCRDCRKRLFPKETNVGRHLRRLVPVTELPRKVWAFETDWNSWK